MGSGLKIGVEVTPRVRTNLAQIWWEVGGGPNKFSPARHACRGSEHFRPEARKFWYWLWPWLFRYAFQRFTEMIQRANGKSVLEGKKSVGAVFVTNERERTLGDHLLIVIDPEAPSGVEQLANAVFLQAPNIPAEAQSRLPPEMATVSIPLEADLPNRLSYTSIIQPVHLCASPLDPC